MPAYILDHGTANAARAFNALDEFTQGYVECALWADANGDCFDRDTETTVAELHPDTLAAMVRDCAKFQAERPHDLDLYVEMGRDLSHAGHDFWLSRNGHGTGFWDRGFGAVGDSLHNHAETFGNVELYLGDDDMVHA